MKKISIVTAILLVISLILPVLVLAHGDERPTSTSMDSTKHMAQKKEKTKVAEPSRKVQEVQMQQPTKITKTNPAISTAKLSTIRDAGILSLFLLLMAIGFSGLVGYSRRHNM